MKNSSAKTYFEIHYDSTVSDRTWYRIKRTLRESGLEINLENLQLVAELKRRNEYTKLSLGQIIYCYQCALDIAKKQILIQGDIAYKELRRLSGYKAHRTTIIRWFQSVPRVEGKYFDRARNYKAEDLVTVFASALIYKTKQAR
ncbi:MAG: hypothetical protein KME29_09515 [Calothrix sp. FI2-JRJ7]|jgi:hypothetical protein|nr:hypothetical protein [Calothrix sp. FI2-JRJ7]